MDWEPFLKALREGGELAREELEDKFLEQAKARAGVAWSQLAGDLRARYERTTRDAFRLASAELLLKSHRPREWAHIDSQFAWQGVTAAALARAAILGVFADLLGAVGAAFTGGTSVVAQGIVDTIAGLFLLRKA